MGMVRSQIQEDGYQMEKGRLQAQENQVHKSRRVRPKLNIDRVK